MGYHLTVEGVVEGSVGESLADRCVLGVSWAGVCWVVAFLALDHVEAS